MTLSIQTLTPETLEFADQILLAAYGGDSRKQRLRKYMALQPDGWILALWDGVPAGVAGTTNYGPIAYIGLVGVAPAYQRRGIALAMMEHIIGWCEQRGRPLLVLDASDAGAPLYERLGFVEDEQTVSFVQDNHSRRPPTSCLVSLLAAADLPAVAAWDAPIFGAHRVAVLELLRQEVPDRVFVARSPGGAISGYLFAQAVTLGPWAARTLSDAEVLLGAALELTYEAGPYVLVPGSNADAISLLGRYGFNSYRLLRHMRLGGTGPIGQRELLYGLASFAIG